MSEMRTPAKFIASVSLVLIIGTFAATAITKSFVVFVAGIAGSLFIPRAMIGDT